MAKKAVNTIQRIVLVTLGILFLLGLVGISVPNRLTESLHLDHGPAPGTPGGTGQNQVLLNRSR